MRFPVIALALAVMAVPSQAFVPGSAFSTGQKRVTSSLVLQTTQSATAPFRTEKVMNDVIFSGDPTEAAYEMNHRDILLQQSVQAPGSGTVVPFSQLLHNDSSDIVEQIVSYGKLYGLLRANGIHLTIVSIGTPEKAQALMDHLEVKEFNIYVDPTNASYDALDLRRGVDRTFGNINTPLAFLERWKNKDTGDLQAVLKKWLKAFYIPPEREQAFLQGGTFVFRKGETVYAHYDPSTAAHASMERVLELATPPRERL